MKTRAHWRCCVLLCIGLFTTSLLFSAQTPGSLDESFQLSPGLDLEPYYSLCQLSSGDLLLLTADRILKVRSDGTFDSEFPYSFVDGFGTVFFHELPNHRLLMFGPNFFDPKSWGVLRLDHEGAFDPTFQSPFAAPDVVSATALQADKTIAAGGDWTDAGGWIVRLQENGALDSSFDSPQPDRTVMSLAIASDRIMVAGSFRTLGSNSSPIVAALRSNDAFDSMFKSPFDPSCEDCSAQSMIIRPSGEIILFGTFLVTGETEFRTLIQLKPKRKHRRGLFKYTTEWTHQPNAAPAGRQAGPRRKVSASGDTDFTVAARLNVDGSLDETFVSPNFAAYEWGFEVYDAVLQPDGRVVIVGMFEQVIGSPPRFVIRLNGDRPQILGQIKVAAIQLQVPENATNALVTLRRTHPENGAASIAYWTEDATAIGGRDYHATNGRVRFAAGEITTTIQVPIFDNRFVDGARTFTLGLSNALGATLGSNTTATITITDDEVNNRVQFSAASFPVKETQSNALVEIVRDFGSTGMVSVDYTIRNATARAGRDYLAVSGTIGFAEGQFTNWFLVPIINTPRADGNRYATLSLREPRNDAVLGGQLNATLAILDDESPTVITTLNESWLRAATRSEGRVRIDRDGVIALSDPIDITSDLTIDGRYHAVTLSGQGAARIFNVTTGVNLTLKNLTLANGFSTNAGAIWNDGNLTLINCVFSNNIARGADGTNGVDGPLSAGQTHDGTPGQDARGGAIVNNGKLFATNSVFIANAAIAGRGGSGGAGAFVTNVIAGHGGNGASGGDASGGAIFSSGPVTFQHSGFITNVAVAGNGGGGNVGAVTNFSANSFLQGYSGTSGTGGDALGGAMVLLGSFSVDHCGFSSNTSMAGRGADGATGHSNWRNGGVGVEGTPGGSAKGGAVFANHTGNVAETVFARNVTMGGDGGSGGGGGMASLAFPSGSGGLGGNGGDGFGGALYSTTEIPLTKASFQRNSARGGHGGFGGGGAGSAAQSGRGGLGGSGGFGGNGIGGALVAAGGTFSNAVFFANQSLAGDGGAGGAGGAPCPCRYSSGGGGGNGGDGGIVKGGAVYFPTGRAEIISSQLAENFSLSGNGGDGGVGPNGFVSSYSNHGPAAGGGGSGGNAGEALGGAIASSAEMFLAHSTFISNRVESGAAGSGMNGGTGRYGAGGGSAGHAGPASGGAVWVENFFSSTSCVFTANSASGGAGGNGGSAGHSSSPFGSLYRLGQAGGDGSAAYGGALMIVSNRAEIIRSTFADNFIHGGNGGNAGHHASTYNDFGASPWGGIGGEVRGGAIEANGGALILRDSSISRNSAFAGDSGITGPGSYTRTWYPPARSGPNGGVAAGGGISLIAGLADVSSCAFDGNRALGGTGGTGGTRLHAQIVGGEGGVGGLTLGGGLFASGGVLAVTNSTFYSNFVTGGLGGIGGANNGGAMGGAGGDAFGGAIHSVTGTVVMVNASFAENFSVSGSGGSGGVGETNTIGQMGVSGSAFGGTLANDSAQFEIVNSLFKHHDGTNAFGEFIDFGNNISSDASFAFTQSSSRNNTDPLVGPLADNGGPTRTLALMSGSPAIDAGSDERCPPTDQRGVTRPFGAHCDIGAFELKERTFSIIGRVRERIGVPGVVVSADNISAMTDEAGLFTIRNLLGGTYIVTPHWGSAEFSPDARRVRIGPDAMNVNFTVHWLRLETTPVIEAGAMSLRMAGMSRSRYVLETSTNLVDWTQVGEFRTDENGMLEIKQMLNTNDAQRYFRAR